MTPDSPAGLSIRNPGSNPRLGWPLSVCLAAAGLVFYALLMALAGRLGLTESVVALVPLAIAALAVFTIWPTTALVFWVFASGMIPFPILGGELFFYDLFTFVLAGLWLLQLMRTGRMEIGGPDYAVAFVALAAGLSILMNLGRVDEVADRFFRLRHFHLEFPCKTNLAATLLWGVYLAGYFLASRMCNTPRKIAWTLAAALAMALGNTAFALREWLVDARGFSRMNRTMGLLQDIQDQGYISMIFVLGIAVALVLGLFKGWRRWAILGAGFFLLLNLIFNFTRSTYLETACGFFVMFLAMRSFRGMIVPLLLVAIIGSIFLVVNVDSSDLVMFTDVGSRKAQGLSLRMVSWQDALRISRDHGGFWGIGLGNYVVYSEAVIFTAWARRSHLSSAHGMYLQILTEQGIPGLVAWLTFFISMMVYFFRRFRQSIIPTQKALNLWCFLLVVVFSLDGLLYMMLLPPGHSHEALMAGYYVWVIWGLGVAYNRLLKQQPENQPAVNVAETS